MFHAARCVKRAGRVRFYSILLDASSKRGFIRPRSEALVPRPDAQQPVKNSIIIIMSKNQHVVPVEGEWGVRGAGNSRLTSVHQTQSEAIAAARVISQNQQSELLIHGRDGKIRERDSHGRDPFPPNG